jgi:formylglycine-generating enzyme required for sulfatase activity
MRLFTSAVLAALLISACPTESSDPGQAEFVSSPVLALGADDQGLTITITDSDPAAESYDLYWIHGAAADPAAVKDGAKMPGVVSGGTIANLTNGETYSVLVTANKAGYAGADSAVQTAAPQVPVQAFVSPPALTLIPGNGMLGYTLSISAPAADSYDLYWAEGTNLAAEAVKGGTKITGVALSGEVISGLVNGTSYSVLAAANKAGYTGVESAVQSAAPLADAVLQQFSHTPALKVGFGDGILTYPEYGVYIALASPTPDSYDIYYKEGKDLGAADIKATGTRISVTNTAIRGIIATGLPKDTYYSLLAVANKALYLSKDSTVVTGRTVPDVYNTPTPAEYKALISLSGTTVTGSGSEGVFIQDRNVTLSDFKIAKYETTFQLWKEVYDWAVQNGYIFACQGAEGHDGRPGCNYGAIDPMNPYVAGTGTGADTSPNRERRPVTMISWRDAVVWCNAYSEKESKNPVYYGDAAYSAVLKDATNVATDEVVMKWDADGYRLPTEAEWEFAARGGNPGDTTTWNYAYAGSDTPDPVAWYSANAGSGGAGNDYGAHPVGTRAANSAGLYDMSGNVVEWCFDKFRDELAAGNLTNPIGFEASMLIRSARGGNYNNRDTEATVFYRRFGGVSTAYTAYYSVGFRVASRAD